MDTITATVLLPPTAPAALPTLDDVRDLHREAAEQMAFHPSGDAATARIASALVAALQPLGVSLPPGVLTPDTDEVVALRSLAWARRQLDRLPSATDDALRAAHAQIRNLLPRA